MLHRIATTNTYYITSKKSLSLNNQCWYFYCLIQAILEGMCCNFCLRLKLWSSINTRVATFEIIAAQINTVRFPFHFFSIYIRPHNPIIYFIKYVSKIPILITPTTSTSDSQFLAIPIGAARCSISLKSLFSLSYSLQSLNFHKARTTFPQVHVLL